MHCEWKWKLRSHNTSYCLIEVVTKAGLTVYKSLVSDNKIWLYKIWTQKGFAWRIRFNKKKILPVSSDVSSRPNWVQAPAKHAALFNCLIPYNISRTLLNCPSDNCTNTALLYNNHIIWIIIKFIFSECYFNVTIKNRQIFYQINF